MIKRSDEQYQEFKRSVLDDPESREEYEAFRAQLLLAERMRDLRKKVHLTQDEVAEKMHTTKSTIARLEAAGGKGKHSPSLNTLVKYACSLGYRLEINFKRAT